MSVTPQYIFHAVTLDHSQVAQLQAPNPASQVKPLVARYFMKVMSASSWEDSGGYCPPESVHVSNYAVIALRNFLVEHVKDPMGIDYTLGRLSELVPEGFRITVGLPVGGAGPTEIENKLKKAMKLFNEAGFNILSPDTPQRSGYIEFEAYAPE